MQEVEAILSQKVKILDSSVSFDLTLSFSDVMKDLSCSKEEIARRFKLLIEQKQTLLRKEITDANTSNLKILQEKSIYFEEVNKSNRQMSQQLNVKNIEIQRLKRRVRLLQEEIQELCEKNRQEKQRFKSFEEHTLGDYKRLQATELKYKKLVAEIDQEKNRKNELQRRVDRMNNESINWGDRINYLMKNRQKGLKEEYEEEINKLNDILYFYEHDNKVVKQELARQREIIKETKEEHQLAIKNVQKKYGMKVFPYFHHSQVQTEENSIKRIDVACEIKVECKECKKINDVVRHLEQKSIHIQTMKDPRTFASSQVQTHYKFMQKQEQKQMILKVKQTLEIAQTQKDIYQTKLQQVYEILENQPSKMDDLKTIGKLESKIAQKERNIEVMKHDNLTLRSLNTILHSELQALKMHVRDATQVRVDSVEFKKKSGVTLRLFTQEYEHGNSQQKIMPQEESARKSRETIVNDKQFSKTVDLNATRKTFTKSSCKTRMDVFTPQIKAKTPKEKMDSTFFTTNPQSHRWQMIEKKLKSPQLFSSSPYVNAVRRQKYKKFSLLKKKRNQESDHGINFTVAF